MDRRELLGVLGATAAGLVAVAGGGARAQEPKGHAHEGGQHDDIHSRCAQACADCMRDCEECFHHCAQQVAAGKREHARAMHLCIDCAEVCGTSAKLCARRSPLMVHTCRACAEACDACIAACEPLDDPEMKRVVETLRRCAQSCREMVRAMGGDEHHEHARPGAAR